MVFYHKNEFIGSYFVASDCFASYYINHKAWNFGWKMIIYVSALDCWCLIFLLQFTMFTFHTISSSFLYKNFQLSFKKIPLKSELDLSAKSQVGFCSWMVLALQSKNNEILFFGLYVRCTLLLCDIRSKLVECRVKCFLNFLDSIIKQLLFCNRAITQIESHFELVFYFIHLILHVC